MRRAVVRLVIVANLLLLAAAVGAEEWFECRVPGTRSFTYRCDKDGKAKPLTVAEADLGASLSRHVAAIQALRPEWNEDRYLAQRTLAEVRSIREALDRAAWRRACVAAWGADSWSCWW